jgi:hypothetical protein
MSQIYTEVSSVVPARPEVVYTVLADYRVGHPAILPKPYFTDLRVEQGGQGAGTVVHTRMVVLGVERVFKLTVSEPEPGRVLKEVDEQAGIVTTFTVTALEPGQQSRVTIATMARASPGVRGLLEKIMNPPLTRQIYRQELKQLADYVRQSPPGTP